jgi:hypothetical protein
MYKNIIVLPYRDRPAHIKVLEINKINWFLTILGNSTLIVVVEQEEGKEFNRGKLLNIGIKEYYEKCESFFILHDIDLYLKGNQKDLYNTDTGDDIVRLFSGHKYSLGGLVKFKKKVLLDINGHPNDIWGWGMEDRALFYRSHIKKYNPTKNKVGDLSQLEQLKHKCSKVVYKNERKELSNNIDNIMKRNHEQKEIFISHSGLSTLNKIDANIQDKNNDEYFIIKTHTENNYIKLLVSI